MAIATNDSTNGGVASSQRSTPSNPTTTAAAAAPPQPLPLLSIFPPSTTTSTSSNTPMPMMMMPPSHPVQLNGIVYPHPHDVLCGRGGQSNVHPGNTQWRMLVATNKELYVTLPKKQKMMLSQSIVNAVRSQIPPGRFLQKDVQNDLWYDVGDKRAQEKTSQALREGAPEIRTKINNAHCTSTSHLESSKAAIDSNNNNNNSVAAETQPTEANPETPTASSPSQDKLTSEADTSTTDVPMNDRRTVDTTTTVVETDATIDTTVVMVPPVPLGHATSKEQMPPPSTIPSSFATGGGVAKHDTTSQGTKTVKSVSSRTNANRTNGSNMVQDEDGDDEYDDDDEETPLPLPPLAPIPMSSHYYHEAQATCSFGSMGLMSDMDQARLMQSFTATATTPSEYHHHHHRTTKYDVSGGSHSTTASLPYNSDSDNTNATIPQGNSAYYNNGTYYSRSNNNNQQQQYSSSTSQPYNHYPSQGSNGYDYMPQPHGPSASYYPNSDIGNYTPAQYHTQAPPMNDVRMPQPVDGGLEPVGLSIGSMMSIGTCSKLEDAGFSFGSAMSCTPIPVNTNYYPSKPGDPSSTNAGSERQYPQQHHSASVRPPDGGLQDVGTSFGSLSLADGERERIIADADRDMAELNDFMNQRDRPSNRPRHNNNSRTNNNNNNHSDVFYDTAIPTTFLHQQKSRGSLLDANDDDDKGDDTTTAEARSQKGAHEWNMLQATVAMQDESVRNVVSVPPMYVMNPTTNSYHHQRHPPNGLMSGYNNNNHPNFDVPTLDRDYSQMSAISVGDDFEPPNSTMANSTTSARYYAYNHKNDNSTTGSRNHHQQNYHHHTNSNDPIENDPNWEQYENSIRQEVVLPPVLKKYCTNRY